MVYTGYPMEPVAFRSKHAKPVPVGERMIHEWHIAQYEVRDDAAEKLVGYKAYCGIQIQAINVIIEPGRVSVLHQECAAFNRLPKWK